MTLGGGGEAMKGGREKRRNCEKKFRKKIEKAKINAEKIQYIYTKGTKIKAYRAEEEFNL
jgi:hypothetical protein